MSRQTAAGCAQCLFAAGVCQQPSQPRLSAGYREETCTILPGHLWEEAVGPWPLSAAAAGSAHGG